MWYQRRWPIRWKDTRIVTIFYCNTMLQLSSRSIRLYCKRNFHLMRSSGPCPQNNHLNNVAVNKGGGEFGSQRRDTGVETQW